VANFDISTILSRFVSTKTKNTKKNKKRRRQGPLPTGTTSGSSPIGNEEFPSVGMEATLADPAHESATVLKNLMANCFNDNENDQYNEDLKKTCKITPHNRKQTVNL